MRLRNKILLLFLALIFITLGASSYIYYYRAKQIIHLQVVHHLESVVDIQENRIKHIVEQMYDKFSLISSRTQLRELLNNYNNNPKEEYQQGMNKILKDAIAPVDNFREAFILNSTGTVVASTNPQRINENYSDKDYFIKAGKERVINDFFLSENKAFHAHLAGPIHQNGDVKGILVVISSMNYLTTMLKDYTGLGETGETVLALRDKNGDAVFINPLRFDPGASLKRTVSKEYTDVPIIQALAKQEKLILESEDYNGEKVIAATGYIEDMDWGLVTKINRKEALAPINELRNIFLLIFLIIAIIVIAITLVFTRTITRPLSRLTKASYKIMEGDYTQRVEVKTKDEVGILAKAFNKMAESLQHARKEIESKIQQVENANEELKQFTYIVSHDLKAPLRAINSISEWIVEDNKERLNEEGQKQLSLLQKKTDYMTVLIDDILQFSRAGRVRGRIEQINVSKVIEEVVELLNPEENVTIEKSSELPVISCEKTHLVQIFQNLISNAIKYSDKERKVIKISCEDKDEQWQFSVADNGPGIPEKEHEKIFHIFHTLHEKNEDSTGIGLAIVKKIIKSHNGNIWLKSEPGKETIFFFTLPKTTNDLKNE